MSNQQTLQQQRAGSAWANIEKIATGYDKRKEYGSLVRGLPAMILSDGLAQTLAFLKAKAGGDRSKREDVAYQQISSWVMGQLGLKGDLLEAILKEDSATYRQATMEALAYLHWLKRFVEAKGWKSEGD